MKNSTKLASVALLSLLCTVALGQSKKFVLFEHFTQASCGPCASQNPIFEANIAANNEGKFHHIAYHTSWPGTDPMYSANPTENDARTQYYNVTGVPRMHMLGSQWSGGPAGVTQSMLDNAAAVGSPIKITVTDVPNGNDRDVTVTIKTTGTVPAGNLVVRTAVVEREIVYGTPPGSNGETIFPNVFRKMLPSTAGDTYTPAPLGQSVVFNYTYTPDPGWDPSEIASIAFVQDEGSEEVLNSGATFDPNWSITTQSGTFSQGSNGNTSNFGSSIENDGATQQDFQITLSSANAPVGWSSDFTVGGNTYATTATVTVNGVSTEAITVNVTPDATAAIADYTLTIENLTNPNDPDASVTFTVMSGVTDLIVSNDAGWGDGGSYDWEQEYIDGLNAAGNTTFAATNTATFRSAAGGGQLGGVINIYYNMAWTFPSLTNDLVTDLQTFMDNGGNLFIAGQDIGWDTWDVGNGGNGTAATQSFYSNYMHATFDSDGNTANSQYTAVAADAVFGNVASSGINDVYGGGNLYPDEITPANGGVAIFNYNGNAAKVGGVRANNGTYKLVYLGIGIEHLNTSAVGDQILKLSHDWFYGTVSTEEFDAAMQALGQNYPNPSSNQTIIPFNNLEENVTLQVVDYTGKVVAEQGVAAGTQRVELNTTQLVSGMYIYQIVSEGAVVTSKTMQVIR